MKQYYVYSHIDNEKIVYIGKGTDARAWTSKRYIQEHSDWVTECIHNDTRFVRMIATNLEQSVAFELERNLIKELNPKWNTEGTTLKCPICKTRTRSVGGLSSHMRHYHKS